MLVVPTNPLTFLTSRFGGKRETRVTAWLGFEEYAASVLYRF